MSIHSCGTETVVTLNAIGYPRERCPRCKPLSPRRSRMHPTLEGRPQAVAVVPARVTPRPPPAIELVYVPPGFEVTKVAKLTSTYVITRDDTDLRAVFTCHPWDLQSTIHQEAALLSQHETPQRRPRRVRRSPGPHPWTLPEEHPRSVEWRRKISIGTSLAKASAKRERAGDQP